MRLDVTGFWKYISSFFNYLTDKSRETWEFFWEGIVFASNDMFKEASRFIDSSAPEYSFTSPTIDNYAININILKSRPTNIDLTRYEGRYVLLSNKIIKSAPSSSGRMTVYNDMIELGKQDYEAIRNVAIGQYVVVNGDRYYKVTNAVGPTESGAREFYTYALVLENANLTYLEGSKISVYLTNGRVYKVDDYVIDLLEIHTNISYNGGRVYRKDVDYTFQDSYVEFNEDIIAAGYVPNNTDLYGKSVSVIEHNLFNSFGALVDVKTWKMFNNNNVSAKAMMCSLIKGLQNSTNEEDYRRCLNLYYGLPVSPDRAEVIGLFESYNYQVLEVDGNDIRIELKDDEELHPFIQVGTQLIIDGQEDTISCTAIIDRAGGEFTVSVDTVAVGDFINVKLPNVLNVSYVKKPAAAQSYFKCSHPTDGAEFEHVVDYVNTTFGKYPEVLVYGNMNGYYHITECAEDGDYIRFYVDDYVDADIEEPRYNDYVDVNTLDSEINVYEATKLHMPWPTHKYLLLKLSDGTLYKAFIDSPIDTIYDTGDVVEKYQTLCRCIDIMNADKFPGWNEFNGFKRHSNGLNLESNMLELISTIPNTKYGYYFAG